MSSEESEKKDFYECLESLVKIVDDSRKSLFGNRISIEKDVIDDAISAIKEALPGALESAKEIVSKQNEILKTARSTADDEIKLAYQDAKTERDRASDDAKKMLDRAHNEATAIIDSANRQSEDIVNRGREQQAQLVSESEVMRVAREEAAKLTAKTNEEIQAAYQANQEEMARIKKETWAYIIANLKKVSESFQTCMNNIAVFNDGINKAISSAQDESNK